MALVWLKAGLVCRRWTPEEDDLLADRYGRDRDIVCARLLSRSVSAIRWRAHKLGLCRTQYFFSAFAVADILSVTQPTVVLWIRKGYLVATRSHTVRCGRPAGGRGPVWRIEEAALRAFMVEHPASYDWRAIDEEAHWAWRALGRRCAREHEALSLRRPWTVHEDAFLLNHGDWSREALAAKLRRTVGAVKCRQNALGRRGHITPWRKRERARVAA